MARQAWDHGGTSMMQTGPQEHTPYGNQPALTHNEFLAQSVRRPKGPEKPDMPALPLENRLTRAFSWPTARDPL